MTGPRILLVLDLDDCLIHSQDVPLDRPADFQPLPGVHGYKRPGLDDFLAGVAQSFDLAVWTSGGSQYAAGIIDRIFPEPSILRFLFTRQRCIEKRTETDDLYFVKDLSKLKRRGFDLGRVLVIDDDRRTFERNYGNGILVQAWHGTDLADDELSHLLQYLRTISDVDDVRAIDKRNWRRR